MVDLKTRWKGMCSETIALANPMSETIAQLQYYTLVQTKARGLLTGSAVLLEVGIEQADLFSRACFGCLIVTYIEDAQMYELTLEEAFYMSYSLKCLEVFSKKHCFKNSDELWELMKLKRELFPIYYKAYAHLRAKNWVVRSGVQYGVHLVAYRHLPSLVHSEYAVIVSEDNDNTNKRLLVWPDLHATVRLENGVAKTLLVLYIKTNGDDTVSPSCLNRFTVEEQTITRWNSEQCCEDKKIVKI